MYGSPNATNPIPAAASRHTSIHRNDRVAVGGTHNEYVAVAPSGFVISGAVAVLMNATVHPGQA